MGLKDTYLLLAPEFGGTKFGPFKGMEIRLGSDPGRNDIVLPEALGVLPEHVTLVAQGDGSFVVAPVDRSAGVFVYRAGAKGKQITSPVAISSGTDTIDSDAFALVTAEGPKFFVLQEDAKKPGMGEDGKKEKFKGASRLTPQSFIKEIRRQGMMTFFTTKFGQYFSYWFAYVRTGAILRPRNMIALAFMATGFIFAGGMGCAVINVAGSRAAAEEELEVCSNDLSFYKGEDDQGGDGIPEVHDLAGRITGVNDVKLVLRDDEVLRAQFVRKVKRILTNDARKNAYRWVFGRKSTLLTKFRKRLEANGVNPQLAGLLAYMVVFENEPNPKPWEQWRDAYGNDVCARGPAKFTYRQAYNLGMTPLELDALVKIDIAESGDTTKQLQALYDTHNILVSAQQLTIDPEALPEKEITSEPAGFAGDLHCLHFVGDDIRTEDKLGELSQAIARQVGKNGKLPAIDGAGGLISRIMRLYAADTKQGFDQYDWSKELSLVSDGIDEVAFGAERDYAVGHTAELLAKAVAIPCIAASDNPKEFPVALGDPPLNWKFQCLVLTGMAGMDMLN